MTKIYVGNLPFSATDAEVRELFAQHGTVESVSIITDRDTGRPRGFGFVEMSRADASKAIQSLNGKELGEADDATTVPLPSWTQVPVDSDSDQSGMVSPAATSLPSRRWVA